MYQVEAAKISYAASLGLLGADVRTLGYSSLGCPRSYLDSPTGPKLGIAAPCLGFRV